MKNTTKKIQQRLTENGYFYRGKSVCRIEAFN